MHPSPSIPLHLHSLLGRSQPPDLMLHENLHEKLQRRFMQRMVIGHPNPSESLPCCPEKDQSIRVPQVLQNKWEMVVPLTIVVGSERTVRLFMPRTKGVWELSSGEH